MEGSPSDAGSGTGGSDSSPLTIVTNREPYTHHYTTDGIRCTRSQGGLITALESAMSSTGGDWVAWGSGSADFDPSVVTPNAEVELPPGEAEYTLKRVSLPDEEVRSYYYGYSNQVLWPLFHRNIDRINLEPGFWDGYRSVNDRFARILDARDATSVWFHDYHFLLAPRRLKDLRSDPVTSVQFIHIPWPGPEVFAICPQKVALLEGVLANDRVGFQNTVHRRNFLNCVETYLGQATVDVRDGVVAFRGETTTTFVQPVGIDPDEVEARSTGSAASDYWRTLVKRHDIDGPVAIGVERLDYTKGILERLDALEHLLAETPRFRGEFRYVQKSLESRTAIEGYRRYSESVRERIHEINDAFRDGSWEPIVYVDEDIPYESLLGLYRHSDVCLVTSTNDGMNLVAQEYAAASRDTQGEIIISEFAGSSALLAPHVVTINPFDIEAVAGKLADALSRAMENDHHDISKTYRRLSEYTVTDWLERNISCM